MFVRLSGRLSLLPDHVVEFRQSEHIGGRGINLAEERFLVLDYL